MYNIIDLNGAPLRVLTVQLKYIIPNLVNMSCRLDHAKSMNGLSSSWNRYLHLIYILNTMFTEEYSCPPSSSS